MAALASNDEDEVRQAGIYGTIYFMGKLLGHDPSFDLVARLSRLDYTVVTPELQSACLAEVQSVADRMRTFRNERRALIAIIVRRGISA
ncbi:MAG: hypothetical protein H7X93_06225 [Sphingomonadaceae bacterium]|nr:hypothetical protein [Sphingomonadaceae bacterium]